MTVGGKVGIREKRWEVIASRRSVGEESDWM